MAVDPIDRVLGPGGLLAGVIEGYEHRPQQIEMARRVRNALERKAFLLAEAGTGTGKTLAYLVPSFLSKRKVVVSTATKNLQEQILFKDVPLLREVLRTPLAPALMKGRQNYLCKLKLERFAGNLEFPSQDDARRWPDIREWTESTETGDRAELDLPDDAPIWRDLSTSSKACLGTSCAHYDACFVTRMRERAREADLVVVNHHLLFADLSLRANAGTTGVEVIPPYDAVVLDEAHAVEEIATSYFGLEVSPMRVVELSRDVANAIPRGDARHDRLAPLLRKAEHLAVETFRLLSRQLLRDAERSIRIAPRHLAPHDESFTDLEAALDAVAGVLGDAEEPPVKAVARRAIEIRNDLLFARKAQEPAWVYWFEDRERTSFLKAAPVDVARELRERFYPRVDTAVFTSATLTAGGRFDYTMSRLGLDAVPREGAAPVDSVALDSPFDFESQAALYAPAHLPEPASPAFLPAAIEEIARLCEVTRGRAFCLFTSLRNMRSAHEALNPRLRYRVLVQGEKPKQRLLTEFRERPSVLFASQSFWEGVDVPGDALSLVVIDKLPFAVPSDPLVAARIDWLKSQERDAFAEYQLPEAAISLRQGFGRLIRTRTDRGIVAVLDPRLSTKRYGRVFVDSLPKCPRFTDLDALAAWWVGR